MKEHWEKIYATKSENEVSWFQEKPTTSLNLIKEYAPTKSVSIIDIGAGQGYLIDYLLLEGYTNITVLDISEHAIENTKKRLGNKANQVKWIVGNVLDVELEKYDVWHDRAVFHFLTTENQITKYKQKVDKHINSFGYFVLGTFSENGPLKCSGLEICQYSDQTANTIFESDFKLKKAFQQNHETPFNTTQNFQFCVFNKK